MFRLPYLQSMARALLIAHPQNATIEELKQVSRLGSNQTLMMDNGSWHKRKMTNGHNWQPMYSPPDWPDINPIERIRRVIKAGWFNN